MGFWGRLKRIFVEDAQTLYKVGEQLKYEVEKHAKTVAAIAEELPNMTKEQIGKAGTAVKELGSKIEKIGRM